MMSYEFPVNQFAMQPDMNDMFLNNNIDYSMLNTLNLFQSIQQTQQLIAQKTADLANFALPDAAVMQQQLVQAQQAPITVATTTPASNSSSGKSSGSSQKSQKSSGRSGNRQAIHFTLEEISQYFSLPITEAAKELGVCTTVLKKVCRRHGINRWPQRKLTSLNKSIKTLQESSMGLINLEGSLKTSLDRLQKKTESLAPAEVVKEEPAPTVPASPVSQTVYNDAPVDDLFPAELFDILA